MKNQVFTKRKLNQSLMQFALITIIVAAVGGYFGYNHYSEYQKAQMALEQETVKLSELKASAEKSKEDYLALKKDLDTQNLTVNQAIEQILPATEDFTNLARDLDKYFLLTDNTANPMFLSNLSFTVPNILETDELARLPFSMNITGNETGIKEFLKYIENSGDLNEQTRLLSIKNLNLGYQEKEAPTTAEGEAAVVETPSYAPAERDVTANLTMDAYFQKPVTINKTPV